MNMTGTRGRDKSITSPPERVPYRRGRRLTLARFQQMATLHRSYMAQKPWWRRSLVGYLLSIPLVALGLLAVLGQDYLMPHNSFPGVPLLISVLLVALGWGVGPALFSVLLSTLALDYFYIHAWVFSLFTWDGLVQFLPFIISGIIVAIISGQREAARIRALAAEQEALIAKQEEQARADELAKANQLKDQFLSIASHELKTPITTIRGLAQIMLRRLSKQSDLPPEQETIRTSLQKIDEQTNRLNALIEDLLDLTSIRAGKIPLQLKRCDLGEVCRGVIEDQRLLTGRTIELELPAEAVVLKADSDRLGQVVTNLVNNAIKYSPEDSPVQVHVDKRDKLAVIEVRDAGPGIPAEEQTRIFETFYRAPKAQASSKNGWGLGLAICKDIVERHGGRIWCESKLGEGSTFMVELPLR